MYIANPSQKQIRHRKIEIGKVAAVCQAVFVIEL
jgi:hypothetical protein